MTDTTVSPYPATPAEVAAAVLDEIERLPEAFSMSRWVWMPEPSGELLPTAEPPCETTLCAAGWTAHKTGWTIVSRDEDDAATDIRFRDDDGQESLTTGHLFAEKDGERRLLSEVAQDALGLSDSETFWYADNDTAIGRLRQIAGRDHDDQGPDMDAGTGHGAYEYR